MKKTIKMIICLLVVLVAAIVTYFFFFREDKKSTLTLQEKNWIESNKNTVFDINIENDIPIFSDSNESLFMDYLTGLEEDTNLEFNKTTNLEDNEYKFMTKDTVSENDILIYQDNYVLVSKSNKLYKKNKDIPQLRVGVLNTDKEKVSKHLNQSYTEFTSYEEMFIEINKEVSTVDALAIPKTFLIDDILENKLNIIYQLGDLKLYYVLSLSDNEKLNNILTKYYKKYKADNYEDKFYDSLSSIYFKTNNIIEKEKSDFRSKRYVYGFIDNVPFDKTYTGKLYGINKEYLESFSKMADIELKYDKYSSYSKLYKNYNNKKIDIIFNYYADSLNKTKSFTTFNNIDPEMVVLTDKTNMITVNSVNSLKNNVVTIKDSKLNKFLEINNIETIEYDGLDKLFSKVNKESVIVIDKQIYDSFNTNELKNYKIVYSFNIDTYGYIVNNNKENEIFSDFLNFYISYINENRIIDEAISGLKKTNKSYDFIFDLVLYILSIIGLVFISKNILKPRKRKITINKEDKLKYIDRLTSLKNRNYLNDSIDKWDSSNIFPQTIMIIDLNNVAYVNDNFGHKAGDKLIAEAAGILIKNQIVNSEIIRTDGNEFLIYLVGYDEKQIVTYKKKLLKELKELEHGFGAEIGYSMILDAIKTSDDAINEATLDMKSAKEDK